MPEDPDLAGFVISASPRPRGCWSTNTFITNTQNGIDVPMQNKAITHGVFNKPRFEASTNDGTNAITPGMNIFTNSSMNRIRRNGKRSALNA